MSTEKDYVKFLQDQVQRLSSALSQYQKKYLPPPKDQQDTLLPSDGPTAPWLLEKRQLSPLLAEYDATIKELTDQVTSYESELQSLAQRVKEVTDENTKLHTDVRKHVERQLQNEGQEGSNSEAILCQRIDSLSQERDNYAELCKQTTEELEAAHKSERDIAKELSKCRSELAAMQKATVDSAKVIDQYKQAYKQLEIDHQKLLNTAQVQETEVVSLQGQLSQCKTDLKATELQNMEFQQAMEELNIQLKRRELERNQFSSVEKTANGHLRQLQSNNIELEAKAAILSRENSMLKTEKNELEENLSSTQGKIATLEQREFEAIQHIRESMQMVENAMLEKEQAQVGEQQKVEEITRLQQSLTALLEEAGHRTKTEVEAVREECNKNITVMAEEIKALETECADKGNTLEKILREKKTVEKELELALQQTPTDTERSSEVIHDYHIKLSAAERARDEALVKLDSLQAAHQRLEAVIHQDKSQIEFLTENKRKLQQQLEEECDQLRKDKIRLTGEIDTFHRELKALQQSKESVQRKHKQELATLAQQHELRENELRQRMEGSEDVHRQSSNELRQLLAAQHRISSRWKEESTALGVKFEQTLTEMRNELIQHKQKNDELSSHLKKQKTRCHGLERQVHEQTGEQASLQSQLEEAEARAELSSTQAASLLSHERQLLQECRALQREVDKLRLELTKVATSHSTPLHHSMPTRTFTGLMANDTDHLLGLGHSTNAQALFDLQQSLHSTRMELGLGDNHRTSKHHSKSSYRSHSHRSHSSHRSHRSGSNSSDTLTAPLSEKELSLASVPSNRDTTSHQ
ncbi:sodium channel and clathrin linker 1-like [Dysidea avara]|uniref:sodium channel and clathrin linker 1-like n=1 Tax=Dysidea avara TaxID=196820 RepID=UPI00331DF2E6